MSSLSFDNIFHPDAVDGTEGTSPSASAARTLKSPLPSGDLVRSFLSEERTPGEASPWAISSARRILDFLVAAVALVAFLPIMAFAALMVRLGSPGPIFFRQLRMGRHGRAFTLYKFRSMCPKKGSNSTITVTGDARITAVGGLLRRYKLDELPQFWNVLRGDMCLVGPRPKLPQHEALHMACRPGITGAATLAFRNEEEFLSEIPEDQLEAFYEMFVKPAKAQLDLDYMRTATLTSDLEIVWRTITACLFSTNESLAKSAETITQFEAARRASRKHTAVGVSHPVPPRAYGPPLNPELASLNQEI
jgi:lipopolysaccharide/colanic/teichoic acid biosynthesis glycosyltransferase